MLAVSHIKATGSKFDLAVERKPTKGNHLNKPVSTRIPDAMYSKFRGLFMAFTTYGRGSIVSHVTRTGLENFPSAKPSDVRSYGHVHWLKDDSYKS